MGSSSINSSHLPFSKYKFHKSPSKHTNHTSKKLSIVLSCHADSTRQFTLTESSRVQKTYSVEFKTLEGCKLGISRYPNFEYNAKGGIGNGIGKSSEEDIINVEFDAKNLYIPSLNGETTKFLGFPLPPFLKIEILPEILRGTIDQRSGKVDLLFKSRFWFSIGSIYKAPPLLVETTLTSSESIGLDKKGLGERLNERGECRLVGVAMVEPINDALMNTFLGLPAECIAYLNAVISINVTN